jgi:hypothetical protein
MITIMEMVALGMSGTGLTPFGTGPLFEVAVQFFDLPVMDICVLKIR